ncbi:MAG: hypothetical protein ACI8SA_000541, partial [Dokdonia sp.]
NNSPIAKEGYFKTIFEHIQPDLIACNELGSNPTNAVKILERCLNVNGETKFQMAQFSTSSGSGLSNAFFYNGDMFSMKSTDKILNDLTGNSLVRLIDVFTLYYNDANLPLGSDTTFLTVFVAHLKAGNGSSNETQRANATASLMNYIEMEGITGNYIFSGDFNVYKASEAAFQNLVNPSNPQVKFIDPVNRMGNWNNNATYADVHTQSTHATGNGCASGGGLDDRFDFALISASIKNDADNIDYVSNSYKAVANDGNHFNGSINNPANISVPAAVLDAIYNGSDHLPVVLDMVITEAQPNTVAEIKQSTFQVDLVNPAMGEIKGVVTGEIGVYTVRAYSITGKLLLQNTFTNRNKGTFSVAINYKGMVLVQVISESGVKKVFKIVQN